MIKATEVRENSGLYSWPSIIMRVSERWKRESEESGKMEQQKQSLEWCDCWLWWKGPWAKGCHSLWKLEKSGKQILPRACDTLILAHWVHFELLTSRTVKICVMVLWRPTKPFRTNTQEKCPFHYRGLECKSGGQETPGGTGKFGLGVQNEAGQRLIVLPREHTGHSIT